MTLIATDSQRLSNVLKWEAFPTNGYHRIAGVANEASATKYVPGTVVGRYLTGGAATALAQAGNTGTGAMGAITVGATAQIGTYTLKITKAGANAGEFTVTDPKGRGVGAGTVATAAQIDGLGFTLADATDFVVGDTIYIAVTGTYKYKRVEATAVDGTQNVYGVVVSDGLGLAREITVPATTDTPIVILYRGPGAVAKQALVFGASVDTQPEFDRAYQQLEARDIMVLEQI